MVNENRLSGLEEEIINTVIEGTFQDEWYSLHYKIALLNIPEDVSVLDEGEYKNKYRLYGRTEDFKNIQQVMVEEKNGSELKLDCGLWVCSGVVLPYVGGIPGILDRPRTVCTRDGRIFIEEDMIKNSIYLNVLPEILSIAGELFKKKELLKEVLENYCTMISNSVNKNY